MATKTYRQFKISTRDRFFTITEVGTTTRHPMNWCGESTREGSWAQATAQAVKDIAVFLANGTEKVFEGRFAFDPKEFESAAYEGYVSHGLSMTDGHYAPIARDVWIRAFRKEVLGAADHIAEYGDAPHDLCYADRVWYGNDAPELVKMSLCDYAARLAAATAGKR